MVDVLVEGSEGLDEEVGLSLSEDMALLAFPFSPVVPAALEARNRLLLGPGSQAGALWGGCHGSTGQLGLCGVGGGVPAALEIIAEIPGARAPSGRAEHRDRIQGRPGRGRGSSGGDPGAVFAGQHGSLL